MRSTLYNKSDLVASDIQTRAEGESCISDRTQTRMLLMSSKKFQFYCPIGEVNLKIHQI